MAKKKLSRDQKRQQKKQKQARLILDFELVDREHDYHLTVISRMPSADETGVE